MIKFSCLMSCYVKDDPLCLRRALQSLSSQTVLASEILFVEDGPLTTGLYKELDSFEKKLPLNRIRLKKNKGLGNALRIGVEACNYGLIARMDADDICREDRFEKQLDYFEQYPELAVVGSWISEFERKESDIYAIRKVPFEHDEIMQMAKFRNPLNHMTVMYRKNAVLNSGNYIPKFLYLEDYILWIKMLSQGYRFANLPECLVNVRAGKEMIKRRGGKGYMKSELALQKEMLNWGFINLPEYFLNISVRSIVRIVPDNIRNIIYRKTLRK